MSPILELLAARHSKDVFVPECKDGPTWTASHLRLDAWAMTRSWAHPCTFGYEIKHSRGDFLRDDKWWGYLPLCNSFWFVAPRGVIEKSELPSEVGLLQPSANMGRLMTVKKAAFRDVQIPESLYRYVLMSRVTIGDERASDLEYWRGWLARKEEAQTIGGQVSKRLAIRFREQVERVEHENQLLRARIEHVEDAERILAEHGIHLYQCRGWNIREQILDRLGLNEVTNLRASLLGLADLLKGLEAALLHNGNGHGPGREEE